MSNIKDFAKETGLSSKIAKVKIKIPNAIKLAKKTEATLLQKKVYNKRFVKKIAGWYGWTVFL